MADDRGLIEKLIAMASQDVSPMERDVARAKLEEWGARDPGPVIEALHRAIATPPPVFTAADLGRFGSFEQWWGADGAWSVSLDVAPDDIEAGVGILMQLARTQARRRLEAPSLRLEGPP